MLKNFYLIIYKSFACKLFDLNLIEVYLQLTKVIGMYLYKVLHDVLWLEEYRE